MNKFISEGHFVRHVNLCYSKIDPEQVKDSLFYLTNRNRKTRCFPLAIERAIRGGKIAELLKKFDPELYYAGLNQQA